jgi:hypothetical protein
MSRYVLFLKAKCQLCPVSYIAWDKGNALTRSLISEVGLKTYALFTYMPYKLVYISITFSINVSFQSV